MSDNTSSSMQRLLETKVMETKVLQQQQQSRQEILSSEEAIALDKTKEANNKYKDYQMAFQESNKELTEYIIAQSQSPATTGQDLSPPVNPTVSPQQSQKNVHVPEVVVDGVCAGCNKQRFKVRVKMQLVNGRPTYTCPFCNRDYKGIQQHVKKCFSKEECRQCHP